jgi:hypothetical protein
MSPANVPIFQFKTIIPIAGALLLLQGAAQVCRCILCIRNGEWPAHLEDVDEMEVIMQHQQQDEDQARADIDEIIDGDQKDNQK